MSQTRRSNRFQALRNDIPYSFAARVDEETLSNEHIAWFTIYLLFMLNNREGVRLSRAAMQALTLQPLPLPLPFPNFGRHHQALADIIAKHQSLFCVQTESDFLEQPVTLERTFFGFVRLLYLDPFEEFQTRFLHRGWNYFFARRTMKTDFQDQEGPLSYFWQILDHPIASAQSSIERIKELAFTYPFPNIYSPSFMDGRGATFLAGLVGPAGARSSQSTRERWPPRSRRQYIDSCSNPTTYSPRYPPQGTYPSLRYSGTRSSNYDPTHGLFPTPPRTLPLAMVPMTRSRRRDQQILAQTGFGPSPFRVSPIAPSVSHAPEPEQYNNPYTAPSYSYFSLHRRSRQRRPIPDHMRETDANPADVDSTTIAITTDGNNMGMSSVQPETTSQANISEEVNEDESMMVVRVERDGQSVRVLVDSLDSSRRGKRVPSLQQDLGGIMDPDECTICKGSWSWVKGNADGAPQTSPADWRLIVHTTTNCPTCRREYTSSQWMSQMVELGRKVSAVQIAPVTAPSSPQGPSDSGNSSIMEENDSEGRNLQRGEVIRSSSSISTLTVVRQPPTHLNESAVVSLDLTEREIPVFERATDIEQSRASSRASSVSSTLSVTLEIPEELYQLATRSSSLFLDSGSSSSLGSYSTDALDTLQLLNLAADLRTDSQSTSTVSETGSGAADDNMSQATSTRDTGDMPTSLNRESLTALNMHNLSDASELPVDQNSNHMALDRALSRTSISSTRSRIPRMSLSRVSNFTEESITAIPFVSGGVRRNIVATSKPYTANSRSRTATQQISRDRIVKLNANSRLPIPFSSSLHAHPLRRASQSPTVNNNRISPQTPDRGLHHEWSKIEEERATISRQSGSSLIGGFQRPTKSSEARASPKSPSKMAHQQWVTPSKINRRPLWR
ncbi:hypothetical protein BDZ91DRAFT_850346 [Kalaharituber pfeilii]|nr:hypothetical protein BDZ91DRAFT_850346 [Kalaharituber pfeilii]